MGEAEVGAAGAMYPRWAQALVVVPRAAARMAEMVAMGKALAARIEAGKGGAIVVADTTEDMRAAARAGAMVVATVEEGKASELAVMAAEWKVGEMWWWMSIYNVSIISI